MGDMQFNGTPEEWEELVNKNKMSNQKQTAVEWYDNQLRKVFSNTTEASNFSHEELLQQAKEVEKERMIDFANNCIKQIEVSNTCELLMVESPKDLYNETYGGGEQ
jgi:hypothetical protein